ncbi:MAG: cytochrome ubiquinol oxidase subunit I, partial [Hansschlegelia sp.]
SRHPLWEDRLDEGTDRSTLGKGMVLDKGRETIATTVLDGEPDAILRMPGDTLAPFLLTVAMALCVVALLLHWWGTAAFGGVCAAAAVIVWLWPQAELGQVEPAPASEVIRG